MRGTWNAFLAAGIEEDSGVTGQTRATQLIKEGRYLAAGPVTATRVMPEQLLRLHDATIEPDDFDDAADAPHPAGQPRLVDDQVDGAGDLRANRAQWQIHAGHQRHHLEPRQQVAR
jgi:hypothetical protein